MNIAAEKIIGKPVYDFKNEKMGKVANLYIDEASHEPTWVTVKTGLLGTHENFVPLTLASIDEEAEALFVAADKDTIENAPQFETGRELMPGEQDRLYQYYRNVIMRNRQAGQKQGQDDDQSTAGQSRRSDNGQTVQAGYPNDDLRAEQDGQTDDYSSRSANMTDTDKSDDTAMTRGDEELHADTRETEAGRARLKKYVITEPAQITIPLRKERLTITREPITDENRDDAMNGQDISEAEHQVVLNQEEPVVEKTNRAEGTLPHSQRRDFPRRDQ